MDVLKLLKKSKKNSLTIVINSAEDILKTIINNITKFKDSVPTDFNKVVPTGYFYGFFFFSYKTILETEKDLQKQIKKSLKNIFGRKQGNLLYDYSLFKKDDKYFKFGFDLSEKDLKLLENYDDPTYLIAYYSGKIKVNIN